MMLKSGGYCPTKDGILDEGGSGSASWSKFELAELAPSAVDSPARAAYPCEIMNLCQELRLR